MFLLVLTCGQHPHGMLLGPACYGHAKMEKSQRHLRQQSPAKEGFLEYGAAGLRLKGEAQPVEQRGEGKVSWEQHRHISGTREDFRMV